MAYQYSTQITENNAKAVGLSIPISLKAGTMICQSIRGKNIQKAKKMLEETIKLKTPVPYTRYNKDVGHKRGIAAGRYPVNASKQILKLLKNAEANAQFKGLSTGNLIVKHASTQKGPTSYHYGRQRTRAKRVHIELVLEEVKK